MIKKSKKNYKIKNKTQKKYDVLNGEIFDNTSDIKIKTSKDHMKVLRIKGGGDHEEVLSLDSSPQYFQLPKRVCIRTESPTEDNPNKDNYGSEDDKNCALVLLEEINKVMANVTETGKDMIKAKISSKFAKDLEGHISSIKGYVEKLSHVVGNNFARVVENRRITDKIIRENIDLKIQLAIHESAKAKINIMKDHSNLASELIIDDTGSPVASRPARWYVKAVTENVEKVDKPTKDDQVGRWKMLVKILIGIIKEANIKQKW